MFLQYHRPIFPTTQLREAIGATSYLGEWAWLSWAAHAGTRAAFGRARSAPSPLRSPRSLKAYTRLERGRVPSWQIQLPLTVRSTSIVSKKAGLRAGNDSPGPHLLYLSVLPNQNPDMYIENGVGPSSSPGPRERGPDSPVQIPYLPGLAAHERPACGWSLREWGETPICTPLKHPSELTGPSGTAYNRRSPT